MFSNWMKFSLSTARLGYEVQTVMALRVLKLARGGKAAETEARRMVAEKGVAFAECGRCSFCSPRRDAWRIPRTKILATAPLASGL